MWGEHAASADYGVDGIPTFILIGPDGSILADDLRGEKMKERIEDLMNAKKPRSQEVQG